MANNQYIASFTSQIIPTFFGTPYELLILIFQTKYQIFKLNNLKDSRILTILKSFNSIGSIYDGIGFKFYSNFIFMFSNVIIVQCFELNKINEFETSFLFRYSKFLMGMILKVVLAWSLGYFLNVVWIWKVLGPKSKTKNSLKLLNENKFKIFKLFLINLGYNVVYITGEFSCDTIISNILEESPLNKSTKSILLKNVIIIFCEFLTWPIKTIFARCSLSPLLQASKKSKNHHYLNKQLLGSLYSGFPVFLFAQFIHIIISLLSSVNRHRG